MRKLTFLSLIAASLFIATQAPAHQGATGIVKERMDAFKVSQQHLKSIIAAAKTDEFDKVENWHASWQNGAGPCRNISLQIAHTPLLRPRPRFGRIFRASRRRQIALPDHP